MKEFKTDQEEFWAGDFGTDYINRNAEDKLISSCTVMFGKIFSKCSGVKSVLELGANRGNNLRAIKNLFSSDVKLSAVEINESAVQELKTIKDITPYHSSILDFESPEKADLVFTRGVLIHINPEELESVYAKMYEFSNRYICVAEYYNPSPVAIPYRGHMDRLFKRDFAGDLLEKFTDLKLVDYGFVYRRDNNFPQDDVSWFLLEKK